MATRASGTASRRPPGAGSTMLFGTFAPLRVEETRSDVRVTGTTFSYAFSKANGLITSVRVLGREWLAGRPLPDLWATPEVDPRTRRWEAAQETRATVRVAKASGERVVIASQGRYGSGKRALPLQYRVTYTIDPDGVVQVDVEHRATGRGLLRWLVFSAGTVRKALVDFYSHVGDLAFSEGTGDWVTEMVPREAGERRLLGARFLPWLQLGNDSSGLDLTVEDAGRISHGWTDSVPAADPLGLAGQSFLLELRRGGVSWDYFSIRNLQTPIRAGWRRSNRFWLAPVPAKRYDPALGDLRVRWLGPHQFHPGFVYPTDDEINALARSGINLVIGGANWRSGLYARPDNAAETRRVIHACHRNGIRIIPYITFTDLENDVPEFATHAEEWQIEPVAEFRHQTNLMCYSAEGWREYWKRDVDTILERFDFDGLYIDFWVGKMACRNTMHGCGIKYPRFTLPGVRDMAWHAFRRVKERPERFILANTNLFAGALINNLVDIRLPGEWANIEETPPALIRGHLNSRRLGCNSLLLRGRVRDTTLRSVSFSLRCQSPMVMGHGRLPAPDAVGAEPEGLLMRYADILRFFGVRDGQCQGAWEQDDALAWTGRNATAYWRRSGRGAMLVLANLSPEATTGRLRVAARARLGISAARRYLLYLPARNELVKDEPVAGSRVGSFALSLRPYEPALIAILPATGAPQPLWATLSDGFEQVRYDRRARRLTFLVRGAPGGRSRVTVYTAGEPLQSCRQGSKSLRVRTRGQLAVFEAATNEVVELSLTGV